MIFKVQHGNNKRRASKTVKSRLKTTENSKLYLRPSQGRCYTTENELGHSESPEFTL